MSARDDALVLVVGAGPVGLLLAARLLVLGVPTRVVERRSGPRVGSRAIGVHPPGLVALRRVGADAAVLAAGVRIEEGRAFGARGLLGTLRLNGTDPVLAVPQHETEAALLAALAAQGGLVDWGVRFEGLRYGRDGGLVARLQAGAEVEEVRAGLLVGCDGRHSRVRLAAGISCRGGPYPDRYLMADLFDGTGLGPYAEIRLHPRGLVESFPLPGGWRRVVVRVTEPEPEPVARVDGVDPEVARRVCRLASERGAGRFDPDGARMTSAFGVERWLARRFAAGRVVLAGDAAHVLSPIGGQGMNLGWLDAIALADAIAGVARCDGAALRAAVERYAVRRRRAARRAIARAAWNTRLGRPCSAAQARWRDALLSRALRPPLARWLLGSFTMRGLA